MIKRKTGADMQFVPYKGTSALMPDLLAGRLQAGIDNVAILTPYIKSGQLRGIAVTSATRTPLLPDLPPVASTVPDFQAMGWFGLFTTGKVPPAVLAALPHRPSRPRSCAKNSRVWGPNHATGRSRNFAPCSTAKPRYGRR